MTETPPRVMYATIYLLATGQITGSLTQTGGASCVDALHGEIDGAYDPAAFYVSLTGTPTAATRPAGTITASTAAISANGTDSAIFSGMPSSAMLAIDGGTPVAVTSASVTFSASDVGTYTLTFSAFPALDQTFEVVAS